MSRATVCPLGYDSNQCDLPLNRPCDNWGYCESQTLSWPLPYYYLDGALIIGSPYYRYMLDKDYVPPFVDDYKPDITDTSWSEHWLEPVMDYEFYTFIISYWEFLGYASACDNPYYNPDPILDADWDLIPF
jgi:hypothetical protein